MTRPPALSDLAGETGWEPIERFNEARTAESYVSGEPEGRRLRVRYFRRPTDDALLGRIWFGGGTQGPPGHVHGGAVAALLDEAMGFSAWMVGHRVVAAHIDVDFRAMVPLHTVATLEARVEKVNGRKVYSRARLELPDGTPAAESTGLFLRLETRHLEKLGRLATDAEMDPEAFG
ncbi:MAG: PaaI family thioesterase [Acidobacteriota bacterium]|nr:PaaI family thioesterase [Acidobacteriota bacterium]